MQPPALFVPLTPLRKRGQREREEKKVGRSEGERACHGVCQNAGVTGGMGGEKRVKTSEI